MSYTSYSATATCTLAVNTAAEAITLLTDWLGNYPDEMPEGLSADGTADEIAGELSAYINMDESGEVIVTVDTEGDDNYNSEVFDFITSHFAQIQTSDYMSVSWSCYDSRDGTSSGTEYYDRNGSQFDMSDRSKDSKALDQITHILSGTSWDVDMLMSISDIIASTGRVVKDLAD
jgi:hypothetical protein